MCILKYYKEFITKNHFILAEKRCLYNVDSTERQHNDETTISAL